MEFKKKMLLFLLLVPTGLLFGSLAEVTAQSDVIETFTTQSPKRSLKSSINVQAVAETLHLNVPVVPSEILSLPRLDYEKILNEEKRQNMGEKMRVSIHRTMENIPGNNWRVFSRSDGKYSWRMVIFSPGAIFIRPHIKKITPATAQIYLYGEDGIDTLKGPVKQSRIHRGEGFWGPTIKGEYLYIEIIQNSGSQTPDLIIDKISHGYRDPISGNVSGDFLNEPLMEKEVSCHVDINCDPEWDSTATGVALIFFEEDGFGYLCSGALIMDQNASFRNWFLTANHCIASNIVANTMEAYFNFRTDVCNGTPPNMWTTPYVGGATFKVGQSSQSGSDFTLLELAADPPDNVSYIGWTIADLSADEAVVGIHHPNGSFQRISYGNGNNDSANLWRDFWRVEWTTGATEQGSSGSPILNDNHQITGQLWGGSSSCTAIGEPDYYGKLGVSWNNGLSDYLGSNSFDCSNPVPLSCNIPYQGNTADVTGNVSVYNCANRDEPGPEAVHSITTIQTGDLTATLSDMSLDLDVFIFSACDNDACAAFGDSTATYYNAPPGTYYVIVDSSKNQTGSYTLIVTGGGCGEVCNTGESQSCDTGQSGVCAAGTRMCEDAGNWGDCVQDNQPSSEICDDSIDNDCDGSTDRDDGDCCPIDGDANEDGNVTPADALMCFQGYLGNIVLDECQQSRCDVYPGGSGDGDITPADALCIFQKYLGLRSCFEG